MIDFNFNFEIQVGNPPNENYLIMYLSLLDLVIELYRILCNSLSFQARLLYTAKVTRRKPSVSRFSFWLHLFI